MRDESWLRFLRTLPCAHCLRMPPSEAHHSTASRFSLARKSSDHDAFPLCRKCHQDFHDAKGDFRDWNKDQRRTWQRAKSDLYRPSREEIKDSRVDTPDEPF